MADKIESGKWYFLRLKRLDKREEKEKSPRVDVLFEVVDGHSRGELIADKFFLSERAISRFETLVHRAGFEGLIKKPEDVTVEVFAKILGAKIYGLAKRDRYGLCIDGWAMRAETDPPEDESLFVDYEQREMSDALLEGIE